MKTLTAVNFLQNPEQYTYVAGSIDNSGVVVFIQQPHQVTSITNMIEVLATKALAAEDHAAGRTLPRFFEYYPAALGPVVEWQEVTFRDVSQLERPGLLSKLLGLVGTGGPQPTVVDRPEWHPVAVEEQRHLRALVGS